MNLCHSELTFIVVNLNDRRGLEATLTSLTRIVSSAKVIIKDGGSTDGSVEFARDWVELYGGTLVSSADSGIFNAMSFATSLVETQQVIFVNSGDSIRDDSSLTRASELLEESSREWLVGGAVLTRNGNPVAYWPFPSRSLMVRLLGIQSFCHQSTIYKTEFLRTVLFDENSILSDWSTALALELKSPPILIPDLLSNFDIDGISNRMSFLRKAVFHTQGREWAGQLLLGSRVWDLAISVLVNWICSVPGARLAVEKVFSKFGLKRAKSGN